VTILVGCALAVGIFGVLSFGEALVLAIILAPTEPTGARRWRALKLPRNGGGSDPGCLVMLIY